MAYWLLKTEPEEFSWDDQVKRGAKGEPWTGVRNFKARSNLKAMKKGEHAFFYHTGDEKQVVGIVEIIREAYPDQTDEKGVFVCVDTRAVKPFPKFVTLADREGGREAEDHGAGARAAPLGAAGDRRGVEADLQDGRGEGVVLALRARRSPAKEASRRARAQAPACAAILRGPPSQELPEAQDNDAGALRVASRCEDGNGCGVRKFVCKLRWREGGESA